jgi:AraC-like DNA-binding protein
VKADFGKPFSLENEAEGAVSTVSFGQDSTTEAGVDNRTLVDILAKSQTYRDFERAFGDLTGLPIALHPVETWQLVHHGKRHENPFCSLISHKSHACASYLQVQEMVCQKAAIGRATVVCPVGLCHSAVPIRMGERLIGFLEIGQVFPRKPTEAQFNRVLELCQKWGIAAPREALQKAYFSGRVVTHEEHDAVVNLLSVFCGHLAMLCNQIFIQQNNSEPPNISKARAHIQEHQSEPLSLTKVAAAVGMSSYYFCKQFKKVTGLNFAQYVARLRLEKARNLLLNPNLRVCEIAFEVGFQSLTHFNRLFKKTFGQPPTDYRAGLLHR